MDSRMRMIVIVAAVGVASLASGGMAGTGALAAARSGHGWGKAIEGCDSVTYHA